MRRTVFRLWLCFSACAWLLAGCRPAVVAESRRPPRASWDIELEFPGLLDLRIKDLEGGTLARPLEAAYRTSGTARAGWDGFSTAGGRLPAGIYRWEADLKGFELKAKGTLLGGGSARSQVLFPRGLALDDKAAKPILYVADAGNRRVQAVDLEGGFIRAMGGFGSGADGGLKSPCGVAAYSGKVYVSDLAEHKVFEFSSRGDFVRAHGGFGREKGLFNEPMGLSVDAMGNLAVADSRNDRVQVLDAFGTVKTVMGGFGSGEGFLRRPAGVWHESPNSVAVADRGNGRLQRFDINGYWRGSLALAGTGAPTFLAGGAGILFVSDEKHRRVNMYTSGGDWLASTEAGALASPAGLALFEGRRLFVADEEAQGVMEFEVAPSARFLSGTLDLEP